MPDFRDPPSAKILIPTSLHRQQGDIETAREAATRWARRSGPSPPPPNGEEMMRKFRRVMSALPAAALGMLVLGCSTTSEPPDMETTNSAVVGGTAASECSWPSTVRLHSAMDCTATLIHPRIVITAAHCLNPSFNFPGDPFPQNQKKTATITFGDNSATSFKIEATCKAGAEGEAGVSTSADWAYCVLPDDDRVKKLPTIPPLSGCEAAAFLKAGLKAWVIGYGWPNANNKTFGTKRQVEVLINRIDQPANGVLDVGDAEHGACHGDSGGPLYARLTDGDHDYGWRVLGTTSGPGAKNCDCACSSVYVNVANHVAQIEKNEGIDVTPCTDSSGAWQPGPDCQGFQSDPANATGSFPTCVVARTTGTIRSCGNSSGSDGSGGSTGADARSGDADINIRRDGASDTMASGGAIGTGGSADTAGTIGAAGSGGGLATGGSSSEVGSGGTGSSGGMVGQGGASGSGGGPGTGGSSTVRGVGTGGGGAPTRSGGSGGSSPKTHAGSQSSGCGIAGGHPSSSTIGMMLVFGLSILWRGFRRTRRRI